MILEIISLCNRFIQELRSSANEKSVAGRYRNLLAYYRMEIIFAKIFLTKFLNPFKTEAEQQELDSILNEMVERVFDNMSESLARFMQKYPEMKAGMTNYVSTRIKVNEPIKSNSKMLDNLLKNLFFLERMLISEENEVGAGFRNAFQVNRTDSLSFYEAIEGKEDPFPSMVRKIKKLVKYSYNTKKTPNPSDFEVGVF